jgi:hypothetical protein
MPSDRDRRPIAVPAQFVRWLELAQSWSGLAILALAWGFLCLLKALLSVALTGYACEQALARAAPPGLREQHSASSGELLQTCTSDTVASGQSGDYGGGRRAAAPTAASYLLTPRGGARADAATSPAAMSPARNGCDSAPFSARTEVRSGGGGFATAADRFNESFDDPIRTDSLVRQGIGQFSASAMLDNSRRPMRGISSISSSAEL